MVVGAAVGCVAGWPVTVGLAVGLAVGSPVGAGVGLAVGLAEGFLVGSRVGFFVGFRVGGFVGATDGPELVGALLGAAVAGDPVGFAVGEDVQYVSWGVLVHRSLASKLHPEPPPHSPSSSARVQSRPPTPAQNAVASFQLSPLWHPPAQASDSPQQVLPPTSFCLQPLTSTLLQHRML